MKLAALMPVRNEGWVLNVTARRALDWADILVILNHASTDRTGEILNGLVNRYRERLCVIDEPDPTWREMEHRQRMLEAARAEGATHIASIDADEMLTPNLVPDIRGLIEDLDPGVILSLPWLAICSRTQYIADGIDQFAAFAWRDDPRFHWASEARGGYQFHHRHPFVKGKSYQQFSGPLTEADGGLMHLQFLDPERLMAKQALYQMQEVLRWPGKYLGSEDPQATEKIAKLYQHTMARLAGPNLNFPTQWNVDPDIWRDINFTVHWTPGGGGCEYSDPWQLTECQRLIAEHGRERFAGLDLFGIV